MNPLFDIELLLCPLINDRLDNTNGYKWGVNCNCFGDKETLLSGISAALAIFRYRYQEHNNDSQNELKQLEEDSNEIERIVRDINVDAENEILAIVKGENQDIDDNTCILFYKEMQSLKTRDAIEKLSIIINKLEALKDKYEI